LRKRKAPAIKPVLSKKQKVSEMSDENVDPNELTIQQIKQRMAKLGHSDKLPVKKENKDHYVALYQKHVQKKKVVVFTYFWKKKISPSTRCCKNTGNFVGKY